MKDWEKFEDIGYGADPEGIQQEQIMRRMVRWQAVIALGAMVGLVVGFVAALMHAPPVGGDWWFYLRFVVATITGLMGLVVGKFVAFGALLIAALISAYVEGRR